MSHKDSVRTSQRTRCASVRKTSQLKLCGEIIAVSCETRLEHMNTLRARNADVFSVNSDGTYTNHWALRLRH